MTARIFDFPAELIEAGNWRRTLANMRALVDDGASQSELRAVLDAHFERAALQSSSRSQRPAAHLDKESS